MPLIVKIEDLEDASDDKGCLVDMPVTTEADSDLHIGDTVFARPPVNSRWRGARFLGSITHLHLGRGACFYGVLFRLGKENVERRLILGRERLALALKGPSPHHG